MKKILFTVLGIFALGLNAQIPEGNFENWDSSGGVWNPKGWTGTNILIPLGNPQTIYRDTGGYQSPYCLKVVTRRMPYIPAGVAPIQGWAATGYFDGKNVQGNFSLQGAYPTHLNAFIEYFPVADDTGFIYAILTKWNSGSNTRDTVGVAGYPLLDYTPTWTQITMPIEYKIGSVQPDSASIYIFGNNQKALDFGTIVRVDSLHFKGSMNVGLEQKVLEARKAIYPNPAGSYAIVPYPNSQYDFYTISGQRMYHKISTSEGRVDLSDVKEGVYMLFAGQAEHQLLWVER